MRESRTSGSGRGMPRKGLIYSTSECLREASPGSQRLYIPARFLVGSLCKNYPPDTLPVLLPDMMSALLLNRLKKQQQRALPGLRETSHALCCVRHTI